jgi:hypothetical protein
MTRLDNARRPKVVPAVATGTGLRLEPKFSVPAQTLKTRWFLHELTRWTPACLVAKTAVDADRIELLRKSTSGKWRTGGGCAYDSPTLCPLDCPQVAHVRMQSAESLSHSLHHNANNPDACHVRTWPKWRHFSFAPGPEARLDLWVCRLDTMGQIAFIYHHVHPSHGVGWFALSLVYPHTVFVKLVERQLSFLTSSPPTKPATVQHLCSMIEVPPRLTIHCGHTLYS